MASEPSSVPYRQESLFLPKLPGELRNEIYGYIFDEEISLENMLQQLQPLLTCRQFCNEASSLAFSRVSRTVIIKGRDVDFIEIAENTLSTDKMITSSSKTCADDLLRVTIQDQSNLEDEWPTFLWINRTLSTLRDEFSYCPKHLGESCTDEGSVIAPKSTLPLLTLLKVAHTLQGIRKNFPHATSEINHITVTADSELKYRWGSRNVYGVSRGLEYLLSYGLRVCQFTHISTLQIAWQFYSPVHYTALHDMLTKLINAVQMGYYSHIHTIRIRDTAMSSLITPLEDFAKVFLDNLPLQLVELLQVPPATPLDSPVPRGVRVFGAVTVHFSILRGNSEQPLAVEFVNSLPGQDRTNFQS
ncbi:hypothetical protein M501DRAFT_1058746 [Patellaria atrata CBS 101060]|uniref:Uncharacterized protein n=1 Tax=Patellaria atrata CBS 101060 TaxID=1346257 RepID=A0A9P4S8I4_9PEZI|nr:hypothetical protein M501DRAFT_1058746 [Patellaria atrata CBS 101060]